jgi:phosphatidylserine/phosphatidylglycerophosphate/cardiolipin synthase-like enzyme
VHDITTLVAANDRRMERTIQKARFEAALSPREPPFTAPLVWRGQPVPRFADLLDADLPGLLAAEAEAFADTPAKLERKPGDWSATTTAFALQTFRQARGELMLYSPYFIPGASGLAGLREARSYGIAVRVITNSLGATDEPQASLAYERYRVQLLQLGVELYEVSAVQTRRDEGSRRVFGHSRAQLHAKLALVDRRTVLLGSMNLDQRSATTNTEMALRVLSPELAAQILAWFSSRERSEVRGAYQVRLRPDGQGLQWVALLGEGRTEVLDEDPEFQPWERLRLWFLSLFVPESLL